jgi:hypothetical protein
MVSGKVPTSALNTHHCTLAELPAALPAWLHDRAGLVKAMARLPGVAAS